MKAALLAFTLLAAGSTGALAAGDNCGCRGGGGGSAGGASGSGGGSFTGLSNTEAFGLAATFGGAMYGPWGSVVFGVAGAGINAGLNAPPQSADSLAAQQAFDRAAAVSMTAPNAWGIY